jgi:hypothetical protein
MTEAPDCIPLAKLVEDYVALLSKAQGVLSDLLMPEKHVSGEAALAELIELLNGADWHALEARRSRLCGHASGPTGSGIPAGHD